LPWIEVSEAEGMCGILGYCAKDGGTLPEQTSFAKALDLMQRRGPDARASATIKGQHGAVAMFGHRRLSIQDTSEAGNQPMISACDRYAITYNGEVYNAPDLRRQLAAKGVNFRSKSDTEVVLEGFARWGSAIVEKLHGMFAFAIWDRKDQTLTLARDHVGIKPLYYAGDFSHLAFSSDARALRPLGFGSETCADAQALYLMLGYVPTPFSIWKGIRKLEPGTILEWQPGAAPTYTRFWAAPEALDSEGNLDELAGLIDEIVEEQLLSDVPLGIFLSGGLDSSLIASSIAKLGTASQDLVCMTVGFPDNPSVDEAPTAQRTAKTLGLKLDVLQLARQTRPTYADAVLALDEPLSFSAIVTQVAISQLAADHDIKVVLTGDGGDEVFGGYAWYQTPLEDVGAKNIRQPSLRNQLLPAARRRQAEARRDYAWAQTHPVIAHLQSVYGGLRADQVSHIADRSEAELTDLLITTMTAEYIPHLPERRRRQRLDLYTFCGDVVLPKVDRAGMHHSIEARPPLLDFRIIDWALSRPITQQMDGAPKAPLRTILRNRGLGFLLDEPKRGFSLKSKDKPGYGQMASEVNRAIQKMAISPKWSAAMPKSGPRHGQRLALMHWLSLWTEAQKGA